MNSSTVQIHHLADGDRGAVEIHARVERVKVSYTVRRGHLSRPWTCAEHGNQHCEHTAAVAALIDHTTWQRMTGTRRPRPGGVRLISVAAPPFGGVRTAVVEATVDGIPVGSLGREWSCLACGTDAAAPCEHAERVMTLLAPGVRQFVRGAER